MLTVLTYIVLTSVAAAWVYAVVFLVLTLENRRFWRSHYRRPAPSMDPFPRAALVIPCKGMEHKLRENLTAFIHQDHPNFEVRFVVESNDDSACQVIRNLIRENRHVKIRLIIAGRADDSGQKVHNLLAATADMDPEIELLVFADSDANPDSSWMRWLVNGIGGERVGARTGYRWMIPCNASLPTLIGCSINNFVASMMGRGSHFPVWGGSWAIHRKVFDAVGMRQAWKGVLSDDLVASRVLKLSRLKIKFEPRCLCTSRVKFTTAQLIVFLRRQMIIGRKYLTGYWLTALIMSVLNQIGCLGATIFGFTLIYQGNVSGWWFLASATALYGLGVARAIVRQNMGRLVTAEWRSCRKARKFDIAAGPVSSFVASLLMIASAFGNRFDWRGIRYHINRGGRILLIGRKMKVEPWELAFRSRLAETNDPKAKIDSWQDKSKKAA